MKKIIAIAMVVVLALTAVVGTTFAYFTDEDSDVNVMTVGNVQIEQNEQERKNGDASNLQDFTQGKNLAPYVEGEGTLKEPVQVGEYEILMRDPDVVKNYVDKIVTVTNTGNSSAYVRTIIAFPLSKNYNPENAAYANWLHWNGVSDTDTNPNNGWIWGADQTTEWPGNAEGWDWVKTVNIGGSAYELYIVTNKNKIEPGETTGPNLVGVYMDSRVEYDGNTYSMTVDGVTYDLGDISKLEILVATQAVQVDGFDNAWDALDTAFGDITETNHPWTNNKVVSYSNGAVVTVNDIITVAGEDTDAVTASGEGTVVTIEGGYYDVANKDCAVWAKDNATVIINDGHFICDGLGEAATSDNHQDMIYAGSSDTEGGRIEIYGGFFEARSEGAWLLNEKDGQGEITVYGGTFVNWNPADNVSEGANTSFVAEGYKVVIEEKADGDIWYTVVAG